jgi:hypothetical protein
MSASASFSASVTPCGIASLDFLERAKSALKLNASQMSTLSALYSQALQQESIESHCQHYLKSKKAACGRELKDGKCPTHGDDVFPPVEVPGEPVKDIPCPFVKKDDSICGRKCAKGKMTCPLHIGKTMSSDMICCTFVLASGERKGQACGRMFGQRIVSADQAEYVPDDYETIKSWCSTHYDAEIKRRIKEKMEKKAKKEAKEKKPKAEKKKKSEVEMKQEADPLDDSDSDDDLPLSQKSTASTSSASYPKFDLKLDDAIVASVFKVRDSEARLLRMKSKQQLYPIIFDRGVYEKEDGVLEIVGYTCDLVNKEVDACEFKKEWHPLMDEVVKFYNTRDYKVRIAPSLRRK